MPIGTVRGSEDSICKCHPEPRFWAKDLQQSVGYPAVYAALGPCGFFVEKPIERKCESMLVTRSFGQNRASGRQVQFSSEIVVNNAVYRERF
jgi:hypothetical protein